MKPVGSFNLLRWFAWLSPIAIGLIALINAWLISSFLNDHLFQREATVTRDFVQNILLSDGSLDYLSQPENIALKPHFDNTIEHLTNMRDVLRANVYGADRRVIWSTDPTLRGQQFAANDELDRALEGKLVVHAGDISHSREKGEHVGLDPSIRYFVESYIPISRPGDGKIIGVVELYKAPLALTEAIQEGRMQVAIAAVISALTLYLCLFWIIRRADRIIKQQRVQLLEAETMAVVGELTSSVAHNIRNPLSSIRSSAELVLAYPQENGSEQAADIIHEVDRISHRITELLRFSGKGAHHVETVDLVALLAECQGDHQPSFSGQDQVLRLEAPGHAAPVLADRALLLQVFQSLLSNANEAMPAGGECVITVSDLDSRYWQVSIADKGCGISAETAEKAFRPFFTTKPKGLGLGLPLARRIVERFGGSLTLDSQHGNGTTVCVNLPQGY
jgi:two-component system sensor histidine kinase HydH